VELERQSAGEHPGVGRLHSHLSLAGVCALEAEEESLERVVGGEVEGEGEGSMMESGCWSLDRRVSKVKEKYEEMKRRKEGGREEALLISRGVESHG